MYKFVHTPDRKYSSSHSVIIEGEGEDLTDVCNMFTAFMKAAGFQMDGFEATYEEDSKDPEREADKEEEIEHLKERLKKEQAHSFQLMRINNENFWRAHSLEADLRSMKKAFGLTEEEIQHEARFHPYDGLHPKSPVDLEEEELGLFAHHYGDVAIAEEEEDEVTMLDMAAKFAKEVEQFVAHDNLKFAAKLKALEE